MALYVVKLPDIGEGTTEAEIVAWHVKVGDRIGEDDPLVDVMTDKATVELPAPVGGTVVALHGAVGEKRPVGSELVALEIESEEAAAGAASAPATAHPSAPPPPPAAGLTRGEAGEGHAAAPAPPAEKPRASPAVRHRALNHGVALQAVPGTGPGGRITQADLDAYLAKGPPAQEAVATMPARAPPPTAVAAGDDAIEAVPIVGLRRAIAAHLEEANRRIPHFSYVEEVDVDALEALRAHLNAAEPQRPHLTLLPFLLRAIVKAAAAHPQVNARFDDDAGILNRFKAVHLGVATQTPNGLVVPVVRHAERLDLWQAAAEIARLAEAARAGKATRAELVGSTITVTSLGALGGIAATPVINLPEVAIVGVNKIVARPIVRDGQIVVARIMNLSSSFDHRIVDGWEAASFIQRVKAGLEHPATLFIG